MLSPVPGSWLALNRVTVVFQLGVVTHRTSLLPQDGHLPTLGPPPASKICQEPRLCLKLGSHAGALLAYILTHLVSFPGSQSFYFPSIFRFLYLLLAPSNCMFLKILFNYTNPWNWLAVYRLLFLESNVHTFHWWILFGNINPNSFTLLCLFTYKMNFEYLYISVALILALGYKKLTNHY